MYRRMPSGEKKLMKIFVISKSIIVLASDTMVEMCALVNNYPIQLRSMGDEVMGTYTSQPLRNCCE